MNYFEYKGIRSSDMGLRIEEKEVFSGPQYGMEFDEIPGRDGDLIAGAGRFPNVQITYTVFVVAKSVSEKKKEAKEKDLPEKPKKNAKERLKQRLDYVEESAMPENWKALYREAVNFKQAPSRRKGPERQNLWNSGFCPICKSPHKPAKMR